MVVPNPFAGPVGPAVLLEADALCHGWVGAPLLRDLSFAVGPGLTLVRGGDGRGKTTLLRLLAGVLAPVSGRVHRHAGAPYWSEPADPADDALTGRQWLARARARFPGGGAAHEAGLLDAFALGAHVDKPLYMLSTGSRRKLGLVAAFSGGARVLLLDVPFAALDGPSRAVLAGLLGNAAADTRRGCVVADHALPAPLAGVVPAATIDLGD